MQPRSLFFCVAFLFALAAAARAATATGLSSFEAIEEPLVKFFPATKKFTPDDFVNITARGAGVFRMTLRYNATWWDGDRDTTNSDRQRAEVKGLGPHQRDGETFFYATTWRTNPDFRGTAGFCHVFQLKAINGDNGAPLVTISIHGQRATVEANPAGNKTIAREFPWKPGIWQTVRLIIKTSRAGDGLLLASVDGDAFQGVKGVELSRPGADEYRPKWGLYRRAAVDAPMGDDYVEHSQVRALALPADFDAKVAQPLQITVSDDNAALEREARAKAQVSSPEKTIAWLLTMPDADSRNFALASIAALWAETDPAAAMAWAENYSRRAVRLDAMTRIFARWADHDVDAAAFWLNRHAPDTDLDSIAWLFATDTTYRYVKRRYALDGAALIKDAAMRGAAFEHVVMIWARQDANAAADFVTRTPSLDDAQKKLLLGKIGPRRAPAPSAMTTVVPGGDAAR